MLPDSDFTFVILAGGHETRIAEMGLEHPKSLTLIGGKPLLLHLIDQCLAYSSNVILQSGLISRSYKEIVENRPSVRINADKANGTATAAAMASLVAETKYMVFLNGDTVNDINYALLVKEFGNMSDNFDAMLAVTQWQLSQNPNSILINEEDVIVRSLEGTSCANISNKYSVRQASSTGVFVIKREVFFQDTISIFKSIEMELIPHLIDSKKIKIYDNGVNLCLDIGTPERIKFANSIMSRLSKIYS